MSLLKIFDSRPTKHLTLLVVVYGIFCTYSGVIGMLFNLLIVPLTNFYNGSIYEHYDFHMNENEMAILISIIANLPVIGSTLSILFLIPKMDEWGRKGVSLHLQNFFGLIGAITFILAKWFNRVEFFMIGQFFIGLCDPIKFTVVRHYLSECAPTKYRGMITYSVSLFQLFTLFPASLLLMPNIFGNEEKWHYMAYISLGLNFLTYIFGLFTKESPKYLYFIGRPKSEVVNAVRAYLGKDIDADKILDNYLREEVHTNSKKLTLKELWHEPTLRKAFVLLCLIVFGVMLTSSSILMQYEMSLMISYGFTQETVLFMNSALQITILPCSFFVPFLFEKIGRKPLLLIGTAIHIILPILSLLAKCLDDKIGPNTASIILGGFSLLLQNLSNLSGHSTAFLVLMSDLLPTGAKVVVSQVCMLIHNLGPMPISLLYPILVQYISGFVFLPFIFVQIICFVYFYKNLFETKQKEVYENIEKVEEQVRSRAASRYFSNITLRPRASTCYMPLLKEPLRKERYGSLSYGRL